MVIRTPVSSAPNFVSLRDTVAGLRSNEHGGSGAIDARRLLGSDAFRAPVAFVDVTRVFPGSSIGYHAHDDEEEIYVVLSGTPLVDVDGDRRRLEPGDVAVVRSGGAHGLRNDTASDVMIAVVALALDGAHGSGGRCSTPA